MAAVDTAVTALSGAMAIGPKVQTVQREIDFSVTNLAAADWFQVFQGEAGDICLGGAVEILVAGTATATFTIGMASGEELLGSTALDAAAGTITPFANTAGIAIGDGATADTIDVEMEVAAAVLGKIRITAVLLKAGDFAG